MSRAVEPLPGRKDAEFDRLIVVEGEKVLVVLGRFVRCAGVVVRGAKLFVGAWGESKGQGMLCRVLGGDEILPLCIWEQKQGSGAGFGGRGVRK